MSNEGAEGLFHLWISDIFSALICAFFWHKLFGGGVKVVGGFFEAGSGFLIKIRLYMSRQQTAFCPLFRCDKPLLLPASWKHHLALLKSNIVPQAGKCLPVFIFKLLLWRHTEHIFELALLRKEIKSCVHIFHAATCLSWLEVGLKNEDPWG